MEEEGKGILRIVQMGGALARNEIADFNQDVSRICSYCNEAISTQDHIKWECSFFAPTRKEIDAELAKIPPQVPPFLHQKWDSTGHESRRNENFLGSRFW